MFGHSDDRSRNNKPAPDSGMLTSEDSKGLNALIGDVSTKFTPSNLQLPTSAPARPSAPEPPTQSVQVNTPASDNKPADLPVHTPPTDDLLDIKQQALQHLSPLVDHLEQSASDRFRTTMMMIQASDNAALIKTAYDAALEINDDKERAQALLDIINEINYFTQHHAGTHKES